VPSCRSGSGGGGAGSADDLPSSAQSNASVSESARREAGSMAARRSAHLLRPGWKCGQRSAGFFACLHCRGQASRSRVGGAAALATGGGFCSERDVWGPRTPACAFPVASHFRRSSRRVAIIFVGTILQFAHNKSPQIVRR